MAQPVQLYICYAEENKNALARLERQLIPMTAAGKIQPWHRGKLDPGVYRDQQIATHLDQAQIIIMLVSASLFNPEYYDSPEMQRAFQLHKEQKVVLIPVIVEPCLWKDSPLGGLEPLPRGGKPAGLDGKAWLNVATEINKVAIQIQSEQATKEPALSAKSSKPRAKSQKPASSKPQPLSGAALTIKAPTTPRPAPSQPALPADTLPSVEEPQPITDAARATTPAYSQDYDHTQNDLQQIAFAILIWEPSQSSYELIANERRTIYDALQNEQHQCTLGSSLSVPTDMSLQDCEIAQAEKSDMTVLLVEPEISPITEWQEFYYTYDDKFLTKILCYYPEAAKSTPGSWRLDETLHSLQKLNYYQDAEITNCHVRTYVLNWVHARRLGDYRDKCKSRSGR